MSSGWQIYWRLLRYTRLYLFAFMVGVLGFIIYASTQWGWAELLKYIVESIEKEDQQAKSLIAVFIAGIFFIRGVGSFLGNYGIAYVARHVVYRLREEMFAKMLFVNNDYYQRQTSGRLLSKMTYDVEQVASASTDALKTLLQEGFTVLGLMVYLTYTQWKLALIFFAMGPLIGGVVNYAGKRLSRLSHDIQDSMGDVAHVVTETIHSYHTVKIYGGESYESNRFLVANAHNLKQSMKLVATQAINTPIVQFLVASAFSIVVWLALQPTIFGDTTTAEFLAFILAAGMLAKPIRQLTQVNTVVQRGVAGARSVFEMLDVPNEANQGKTRLSHVAGSLKFDQIELRFKGQPEPAVSNFTLSIRPGEKVALVGRSGAGKTSVVNLVARFLEPSSGTVYLDDHPLQDLELQHLRQQLAIVSQQGQLFNDSVLRNIAYGALEDVDEQAVWDILNQVNAAEFVAALPQGIHTPIGGEQGTQLSGGQQQRIMLARALLKNAAIVILDEATSALDQETEKVIQEALDILLQDKTAIIIAHRLSTIESVDRIVVLEAGKIVEQGTHAALLAANGPYARLYHAGLSEA